MSLRFDPLRFCRRPTRARLGACCLAALVLSASPQLVQTAAAASAAPVVGAAASPTGGGWTVTSTGQVTPYGGARYFGSVGSVQLNRPVVGIAAMSDGGGYWLVASDGGVFTFGDARYYGSTGNVQLNRPVVGIGAARDGGGYWLVASDGGVFTFGDARYFGSTGNVQLNRPVVGMAPTPDGGGYWLVASDGGVFTFGDARYFGSTGNVQLNRPVVGITPASDGLGYRLVASDGGLFVFGSARFLGSDGNLALSAPVTAAATTADGAGYWLVDASGRLYPFGTAVPQPTTEPTSAGAMPSSARTITAGAYIPDPYWSPSTWPTALDQYDAAAGHRPSVVQWYVEWQGAQPFPTATADYVRSRNQTPMLTWESWDWNGTASQPAYSDASITAGNYDSYITNWAQSAKAFGTTVYLRWGAEMNGNWNPWDPGVNGNTAADYVAAWRHIHNIFTAVGAANVRWLWTPITQYTGSTPLASVYPGDAYVDMVGVDGYNWGTTKPTTSWQSFSQVFDPTITGITALTSKPLWITEVASTEVGGDKAAWITDMMHTIAVDPRIQGFVWFDANKETDWRINSSPAAQQAFAQGLSTLPLAP